MTKMMVIARSFRGRDAAVERSEAEMRIERAITRSRDAYKGRPGRAKKERRTDGFGGCGSLALGREQNKYNYITRDDGDKRRAARCHDVSDVYLIVDIEQHVLGQVSEIRLVAGELVRHRGPAQLVQALRGKYP